MIYVYIEYVTIAIVSCNGRIANIIPRLITFHIHSQRLVTPKKRVVIALYIYVNKFSDCIRYKSRAAVPS